LHNGMLAERCIALSAVDCLGSHNKLPRWQQTCVAVVVLLQNDLLAVPAGPGRSVAYTLGISNAPKVTNLQLLQTLFTNPKQLMPMLFRCACMHWGMCACHCPPVRLWHY
jgi:hypothetical protein